MDKNIYVVSRCVSEQQDFFNRFHFIGYFNGERVKEIYVHGGNFQLGEDYLLELDGVYCQGSALFGSLVKSKRIFE